MVSMNTLFRPFWKNNTVMILYIFNTVKDGKQFSTCSIVPFILEEVICQNIVLED